MYLIFIYSSVDGHLGWFHALTVHNAGVNAAVSFCLDICPGVGLLDHMTTLFLVKNHLFVATKWGRPGIPKHSLILRHKRNQSQKEPQRPPTSRELVPSFSTNTPFS